VSSVKKVNKHLFNAGLTGVDVKAMQSGKACSFKPFKSGVCQSGGYCGNLILPIFLIFQFCFIIIHLP
jgi:hypothetical protein